MSIGHHPSTSVSAETFALPVNHPESAALRFSAAALPIALFAALQIPLTLPTLSVMALASAGVIASAAWAMRLKRGTPPVNLWDIAGAYAILGFATGMLSEPEQVTEILALPEELLR